MIPAFAEPSRSADHVPMASPGALRPVGSRGGAQRPDRPIRVLIADDHEFVRRGLRALLAEAPTLFEICGEAASGREAVEKARNLKPDVAVVDISMPGLNGLEATRQIVKSLPKTEVMVLTMHESEQLVAELLKAGARGYLLKSDLARDLPAAIESLYQQRPFFTSKVARRVLEGYLKEAARGGSSPILTPAERRVIQLVAEGKSNKEVAAIEGIRVKTAETHRANLMRKLGLRSVSDLVHYAVKNEIIDA